MQGSWLVRESLGGGGEEVLIRSSRCDGIMTSVFCDWSLPKPPKLGKIMAQSP